MPLQFFLVETLFLFIDMNSFFASCEQQVNYYLRNRPVAVCVYPSKFGCIIAPSIEAKKVGIKTGMRLNEAMQLCPELVPLETNAQRYRYFHVKIMNVLKSYTDKVIPRSIDEAVMDISDCHLIYKDTEKLAKQIKKDIHDKVGDWLKCSIGIAPNAFLAKLATDLQKPDGLVKIMPENIDEVLSKLQLTDLPGIAKGMSERLIKAGIKTPLDIRYSNEQRLKAACQSIVGIYWHQRLNFKNVKIDTDFSGYKSMSAMRHLSSEQRKDVKSLHDILMWMCFKLEQRMVKFHVCCKEISLFFKYENGQSWQQKYHSQKSVQDGMELHSIAKLMIEKYEHANHSGQLINSNLVSMGFAIYNFIPEDAIALQLFEDEDKKKIVRKKLYEIKEKFGSEKLMRGAEMKNEFVHKDIIGFGNIKDL